MQGFHIEKFFHNSIDMFSQISDMDVPQHWEKNSHTSN